MITPPSARQEEPQRDLSYRERFGMAAGLQSAVLRRLRGWCGLRLYAIYSMAIDTGKTADAPTGFSARLFTDGDAEQLIAHAQSPALELSPAFVRDALGKSDVCLAIFAGSEIVAYTWCAFTPSHDDDGVFVRFGDAYRYAYKSFTLPAYRGRHLLRYFTHLRDRYCFQERGRTHSIAFVDLDNRASIRATESLGSRRIGTAGYVRWGRFFFPFATAGARAHNFQFFKPVDPRHSGGG